MVNALMAMAFFCRGLAAVDWTALLCCQIFRQKHGGLLTGGMFKNRSCCRHHHTVGLRRSFVAVQGLIGIYRYVILAGRF